MQNNLRDAHEKLDESEAAKRIVEKNAKEQAEDLKRVQEKLKVSE